MAGHHSFDTKLEYATDSGFSSGLTEVTGVLTISGFDQTVTKTATHHLRVSGAKKTYTPGLIDSGPIVANVDYDETVYAALEVLLHARSTTFKYWRVTLPGSSTLIGQGFVSMLNIDVPDDERLTYTLEVCPSAGWDFTAV